MATNHDKYIVERFLQDYNAEKSRAYVVLEWPDDNDRTGKAIDALAADGDDRLAIEHTILQPFVGEKKDASVFLKTVGTLDKADHLKLPGFSVTLSFDVGAVPTRTDWSKVAPAVEQWYLARREAIQTGSSKHVVPELPFELTVAVSKSALNSSLGFFFIGRVAPEQRPLDDTVAQALNTKVEKLTAASADKRILLLEKDVPIYGNGEVGEIVERLLPNFPKLSQVHEIWVVDTVALESENYVAIDLVWPLASAEDRDYARNGG